jgi:hypothetical protein
MSRALERGEVFFLYRPRVGTDEVRSLADVQRFLLVLEPDGRPIRRSLVVGRKRLPDPEDHERVWAFVADVTERSGEYEPPPDARVAGEGRYALVDHNGHTHLAYVLARPRDPGPAQETFRIRPEASYIVAVRNPDAPAPPGAGLAERQRAELPPELRERFGGRRFIPLDPPELLDHDHVELILIGAAEDATQELGIELDADDERVECDQILETLR